MFEFQNNPVQEYVHKAFRSYSEAIDAEIGKIAQLHYETGVAICDAGIAEHPESSSLYTAKAIGLFKLHRDPEAVLACEKSLEKQPNNNMASFYLRMAKVISDSKVPFKKKVTC
jgi:hypothetical protein